jgi:hypothetical protein
MNYSAEILELSRKVPDIRSWDHTKVVSFKIELRRSIKLAQSKNAKEPELRAQLGFLRSYYEASQ